MNRKKQMLRKRKLMKRLILIWGMLGVIGLIGIIYVLGNWFFGLFAGQRENGEGMGDKKYVWSEETVGDAFLGETGLEETFLQGENVWESENGLLHVMPEVASEEQERIMMTQACRELYEANKELLVLVNKEHALEDESYTENLRNICYGRLQASKTLYSDLVELLAAADEAGYQYWIASAYRSKERQQELVEEDVTRYMAQGMNRQEALAKTYEQTMPAGKSEHETGLALDILCSENLNMDASQAKEAGNKWLVEHAHEYGFILRYPEGAENITGIFYEPWHFRYVGKEAAVFLWENELTLEEFWEMLE